VEHARNKDYYIKKLTQNKAVARKHKYVLAITSTENLLLRDDSVLTIETLN